MDYFNNELYDEMGSEEENLYSENDEASITEPFNPKDVDIIMQPMVIANIIDQLKYGDIILDPDFQRRPDLWDKIRQSRLIESLIIRIPLPAFYFDSDTSDDCNDNKLIVVDGLQRLTAIQRFAVLKEDDEEKLKLTGLEYLNEFEGCTFEKLPISIQRRINQQTVTAYIIRPGTPEKVRTSIFTRINTGGFELKPAEIKNSVYRGQAANLLKKLASSKEFRSATRNKISSLRMEDCEFVNRFLAFYILGLDNYSGNLESYLNDVLIQIQKESPANLEKYRQDFLKAMKYAYNIFGDGTFRKINRNQKYGKINKPLFDSVSVNLARLSEADCKKLVEKRHILVEKYKNLLQEPKFMDIISNGTAKIENVRDRHRKIYKLFRGVIDSD